MSTNITSVRISPSNVSGKKILPGIALPDPSKPPSFQLNKSKNRSCEGNSWVLVISLHTRKGHFLLHATSQFSTGKNNLTRDI